MGETEDFEWDDMKDAVNGKIADYRFRWRLAYSTDGHGSKAFRENPRPERSDLKRWPNLTDMCYFACGRGTVNAVGSFH